MLCMFTAIIAQTNHTINAGTYYYTPSEITINQGDIVTWINDGGFHDVNGDINSITDESFNNPEVFDSPATSTAGAVIYTHEFNISGTYNYDCSVGSHAAQGMVGQIIVTPTPTTVVDIIVNSENHTTLEAAVIAAELDDDLSTDGPFTVFAPTDDAFNALPAGTVEALLIDPTGDLANILLHHVYSGSALSTDLIDGMMIPTLFGTELTVSISDDGVMIDNAMVTVANITADNGVVHVIDAVLIPAEESNTVVDIIVNSENHTTLEAAVIAAELDDDLSTDGPFTVFAPTDDAFNALPAGTVEALLIDPTGDLANILLHHVYSGSALSTDLIDGMMIPTLFGTELTVSISDDGVMIDNAMVTVANITADNGVVHVIDAVLIPAEDCTNDDSFINDIFGTFFVSDCPALINFLANSYNYSTFESCNWDGSPMNDFGGLLISDICECSCEDVEEPTTTVVDIIVNSENHTTLEAAVIAAELDDDLSTDGPFTVFAPTDDAFDALPAGTVEALLEDPTGQLANILLHHVYSGSALSTDLTDGMMIPTLFGTELTVSISDDGVMIDNAMVTVANITADNGVVHVINAVLIPEENSSINDNFNLNDEYLYSIDLLGRKTTSKDQIIIDVYQSGKTVKRQIIK